MINDGLPIGSLWKLVGERAAWLPSRLFVRLRKLLLIAARAPEQVQILAILGHPAYAGLRRAFPRLPFKYLEDRYLAEGLTLEDRAACLLHHYRRLLHKLPHGVLRGLAEQEAELLEMRDAEGARYAVKMGLPRLFQDEGEMLLKLQVDGTEIFVLSFTMTPGRVVGSRNEDVLLITRLQGVPGRFEEIQRTTRALNDVAPGAFLMAALQGLAEAWGIREMAAICARRHRSYEARYAGELTAAYDEFFLALGAQRNGKEFFVSRLPLSLKPLTLVKRGHKLRTRQKRAFKQEIAERVARRLQEMQGAAAMR
jgi:hypothetical protein